MPAQEARRQFDVNFFGMVNMNRAVLPIMRQQGGGRIVNMSSVAAPIAIPFQAYYSASKAAVRTYSLALASEVRPFGIEVCVIMPGDIATGFTAARRKSCDGDVVYHGRIARSVAVMEHDEQTGMSAEYAGQFVARRADRACDPDCRQDLRILIQLLSSLRRKIPLPPSRQLPSILLHPVRRVSPLPAAAGLPLVPSQPGAVFLCSA